MSKFLEKVDKIHFVGIGGISMSALAKFSLLHFKSVSGSDKEFSPLIKELQDLGAKICIGNTSIEKIMPELVVYSSAVGDDNVELQMAKTLKIKIVKRAEFLSLILDTFKSSICVCGCHGKTTTTAMLTHIFMTAGKLPTCFIGGSDNHFGNFFFGDNKVAIAEACEYKKNFLYLSPKTIVCTNIDTDHPDSFSSLEDTKQAFLEFVSGKDYVCNADDLNSLDLVKNATLTFGIERGVVRAEDIKHNFYSTTFNAYYKGRILGEINLKTKGIFNVYNALASISIALLYKIDFEQIKLALDSFDGVKRRMEKVGDYKNLEVFIDYAHHPKEIEESIKTYVDDKTLVVFQPHTFSRTEMLMNEFLESLNIKNQVVIYKTYPARESFNAKGDALTLYKRLRKIKKDTYYANNREKLVKTINKYINQYNKIIFFGAGDINKVAESLK